MAYNNLNQGTQNTFFPPSEQTLAAARRQQWHWLFMQPVAARATVLTTFQMYGIYQPWQGSRGDNKGTVENPFRNVWTVLECLNCFGFLESAEWIVKCGEMCRISQGLRSDLPSAIKAILSGHLWTFQSSRWTPGPCTLPGVFATAKPLATDSRERSQRSCMLYNPVAKEENILLGMM